MPSAMGVTPHNDNAHLTTAKRAYDGGVAGLYSCNTLLHKHINPCMEEYHFCRATTDNGAVFVNAVSGTGSNLSSPGRMQVAASVLEGSNSRCVIPYAFEITGNFMEVSALLYGSDEGVGVNNLLFIGMKESLASCVPAIGANMAGFYKKQDGLWWHGAFSNTHGDESSSTGTLGRPIQDKDLLTVRYYRKEGSANIDSIAYYVNGLRISYLEAPIGLIPAVNLYPGFGAYVNSGAGDAAAYPYMEIRSFNFKYNP